MNIWETICASKLLSGACLVLMLNKIDLLKKKLDSGISFSHYVRSYRGPANHVEVADCKPRFTLKCCVLFTKCHMELGKDLRRKFILTAKQKFVDVKSRLVHAHVTCAIVSMYFPSNVSSWIEYFCLTSQDAAIMTQVISRGTFYW